MFRCQPILPRQEQAEQANETLRLSLLRHREAPNSHRRQEPSQNHHREWNPTRLTNGTLNRLPESNPCQPRESNPHHPLQPSQSPLLEENPSRRYLQNLAWQRSRRLNLTSIPPVQSAWRAPLRRDKAAFSRAHLFSILSSRFSINFSTFSLSVKRVPAVRTSWCRPGSSTRAACVCRPERRASWKRRRRAGRRDW